MQMRQWTRRLAATGCAAGIGLAVIGAGTANAQGGDPTTQPAPITIGSAEVEQLCERVPPLEAKVDALINRINAGPDVTGSTQWLHAEAQQARVNGHPARADMLDGRAERRTGVLTILRDVRTGLTDFSTAHCAGATSTSGGGQ